MPESDDAALAGPCKVCHSTNTCTHDTSSATERSGFCKDCGFVWYVPVPPKVDA